MVERGPPSETDEAGAEPASSDAATPGDGAATVYAPEVLTVPAAPSTGSTVLDLPAAEQPPVRIPLTKSSDFVIDLSDLSKFGGARAAEAPAPPPAPPPSDPASPKTPAPTRASDPPSTATAALKGPRRSDLRTTSSRRLAIVAPEPEASDDPLVGQTIEGKYRVLAPLGAGGMASVYRAWHLLLGREIALKFIRPGSADSEQFRERFFREAQISTELIHPHIVPTREFGETDGGAFFMVMDFIKGRTLSALLAEQGRLPVARAVELVTQVLDGVGAVHGRGVVHGDLKPSNLMIDEKGQAWVLDFGLARYQGEDLGGTTGVAGTPLYMAPEQAAGSACDARADLFALGLILHECLCGVRPHRGTLDEVLRLRRTTEIPRPVDLVGDVAVPPRVEAALMKALAREPAARWATAEEFRAALLAAVGAPPAAAPPRIPPLAVAVGAASCLAVAFLWSLSGSPPAPPPPPVVTTEPPRTTVITTPPPVAPVSTTLPARPVVNSADVLRARAAALDAGARQFAPEELAAIDAEWALASGLTGERGADARASAREWFVKTEALASGRRKLADFLARRAAAVAAVTATDAELRALLADVTAAERFVAASALVERARARTADAALDPLTLDQAALGPALEREEVAALAWEEARDRLAQLLGPAREADPNARVAARRELALSAGAAKEAEVELREAESRWAEARARRGQEGLAALEQAAAGFDAVAALAVGRVDVDSLAAEVQRLSTECREALERARRHLADVHLRDEFRLAASRFDAAALLDSTPPPRNVGAARASLERRRDAWRAARALLVPLADQSGELNDVKRLLSTLAAGMVRADLRAVEATYLDPGDDHRYWLALFERAQKVRFLAGTPRITGADATADVTELSYEDRTSGRRVAVTELRISMRKVEGAWRVVNIRRVAR
jgi:serine/threonine protein kinase